MVYFRAKLIPFAQKLLHRNKPHVRTYTRAQPSESIPLERTDNKDPTRKNHNHKNSNVFAIMYVHVYEPIAFTLYAEHFAHASYESWGWCPMTMTIACRQHRGNIVRACNCVCVCAHVLPIDARGLHAMVRSHARCHVAPNVIIYASAPRRVRAAITLCTLAGACGGQTIAATARCYPASRWLDYCCSCWSILNNNNTGIILGGTKKINKSVITTNCL